MNCLTHHGRKRHRTLTTEAEAMRIPRDVLFRHPVVRRYIVCLALTVCGTAIALFLSTYFGIVGEAFDKYVSAFPRWIQYGFLSLASAILWTAVIRLGGFRVGHMSLRRILRYPPTWLSAVLAGCTYLLIVALYSDTFQAASIDLAWAYLRYLSSIPVGIVAATLFHECTSWRSRSTLHELPDPDNAVPGDFEHWLENDFPIRYPWEDVFSHAPIARRVADYICRNEYKTIGLIGSYGSGKSSVLNLIEYYVEHDSPGSQKSRILICRVTGWGRTKGSVAKQILSLSITRLKKEVDCLSVITVPSSYRKALEGLQSPLATVIAALLNTWTDALEQLERIDYILQATGDRLIIYLEDLDRSMDPEIMIEEVPSLLDRLGSLENIGFVLAIGTEHRYSSYLQRVCAHVEWLP